MKTRDKTVLVAVLKRKRDLAILLRDHWYHMPVAKAPRRAFRYLAFYQPSYFGREGKRIRYWARVLDRRVRRRRELFPREADHPRAGDRYWQIRVGRIQKLPRPIVNMPPRRVSFGFTTIGCLRTARTILNLYRVFPSEAAVARALRKANIRAISQYWVSGRRRYRLDFAVIRGDRRIAIECDNEKAHASKAQRRRDRIKDTHLRRAGWRVVRLRERDIIRNLDACVKRVLRAIG